MKTAAIRLYSLGKYEEQYMAVDKFSRFLIKSY